jgi:hypothetical protein
LFVGPPTNHNHLQHSTTADSKPHFPTHTTTCNQPQPPPRQMKITSNTHRNHNHLQHTPQDEACTNLV